MCKGPSMPRNGQISGLHPCLQCVVFTESCWVQSRICCLVFICISHHFILLDQILLGSKALLFQSWALNTHLSFASQFSCFHSWLRAHLALQREPPQISSVTFATKPYLTSLQHETLSSFPNCMLLSASYFSNNFFPFWVALIFSRIALAHLRVFNSITYLQSETFCVFPMLLYLLKVYKTDLTLLICFDLILNESGGEHAFPLQMKTLISYDTEEPIPVSPDSKCHASFSYPHCSPSWGSMVTQFSEQWMCPRADDMA